MSELSPPLPPALRRRQRLEEVRRREQQISILMCQQRLEVAALASEDLAGLSTRYVADELAMVWKRSPRQSRNRLESAQCFADFPAVHALVVDGTWLIDHADAVVDELVGSGLEEDQKQQVLDLVLSRNVHRTPWELRRGVRTAAVVLFPEHAATKAEQAVVDRGVQVHLSDPGGASLYAHGPAAAVAAMFASLDALTFPAAPDDPRTVEQRRFDALQDLVCGRSQPGQWQVQALVALSTLDGQDELPGELVGFGPLPASQARELAAVGSLRRIVVDDVSGRLVTVDETMHRPDQAPARPDQAVPEVLAPRRGVDPRTDPDAVDADEPDPDAPTPADLDWHEAHTDRDRLYTRLDRLRGGQERRAPGGHIPEPPVVPQDAACSPAALAYLAAQWSEAGYRGALARMRTDPVRPLDLHTDRYAVPARLKRHLVLRDRTCVFPGCPRKALRCDKDHLIPWPRGSTSEANLANECEHHHQGKHDCLDLQRLPDGTFRWTTPAGITADRPPRPVLESWVYRTTRRTIRPAKAEPAKDEPGKAA